MGMFDTKAVKSLTRPIAGYTRFNEPKLIRGGREYFSCLKEIIDNAIYTIHFHVYIFDEDETARMVGDALKAAAQRGVKVFMLLDGYASKDLSAEFRDSLRSAGIFFRYFEPVLRTKTFYFGRRLHHKILLADAYHCLVGGINISNKYNDIADDPAWLDWALYANGDIAVELQKICTRLFTRSSVKAARLLSLPRIENFVRDQCFIRARRNDWVHRKTQVSSSYYEMLRNARERITIMSSYFLPGYNIRKQLAKAASRGVKITLILAGSSDIRLAKHAERFIYRWLLRHNIRIFEYQHSVLHGKMATYDCKWVTIGSYNVNNISAFASIELNLDVLDTEFAQHVDDRMKKVLTECVEITEDIYKTQFSLFGRFIQWISYNTVKFLFYIFTFYFKQRE